MNCSYCLAIAWPQCYCMCRGLGVRHGLRQPIEGDLLQGEIGQPPMQPHSPLAAPQPSRQPWEALGPSPSPLYCARSDDSSFSQQRGVDRCRLLWLLLCHMV